MFKINNDKPENTWTIKYVHHINKLPLSCWPQMEAYIFHQLENIHDIIYEILRRFAFEFIDVDA